MIDSSKIKEFAREAGFDLCGIARVRRLEEQSERLLAWLDNGWNSGLGYMERNIDKRLDPALLFDGARSVIVCAANYKNEFWNQHGHESPKISSYALAQDYHVTMKGKLNAMLERLAGEYPGLCGRCFTDSAPILEKSWAIEAGLGWRGRNSLVITPSHGSFIFLGEIVMDTEADRYDDAFAQDLCGTCTACIDACPNSAIIKPYVIDTNRCISRLTTERPSENIGHETDTFPSDSAAPIAGTHGWIFGCDVCQSVCPYNSRTKPFTDPAFTTLFNPEKAGRTFWDGLDEEGFDKTFGTTPIARTGFGPIKERAAQFFEDKDGDNQSV